MRTTCRIVGSPSSLRDLSMDRHPALESWKNAVIETGTFHTESEHHAAIFKLLNKLLLAGPQGTCAAALNQRDLALLKNLHISTRQAEFVVRYTALETIRKHAVESLETPHSQSQAVAVTQLVQALKTHNFNKWIDPSVILSVEAVGIKGLSLYRFKEIGPWDLPSYNSLRDYLDEFIGSEPRLQFLKSRNSRPRVLTTITKSTHQSEPLSSLEFSGIRSS